MEPFDPWNDAALQAVAELDRAEACAFAQRAVVLARMLESASAKDQGWDGRAPWAGLVLEVAGTSRVSQRTAETRLDDARHLVRNLPAAHAAMARGELLVPHALALISETVACTRDVCAEVEAAVLVQAESCTPAELRNRVKKAVIAADPVAAQERHDEAKRERATWVKPAPDGMALLGAYVTATQGRRFAGDLTALLGRTVVADGDDRTQAQREADLVADLPGLALELLDRFHGVLPPLGIPSGIDRYLPDTPVPAENRSSRRRRRKTQVVVQVPVATALDLSAGPVWLDGYGWITAQQGMALLPEAELRKACVDPRSGRLITVSEPGVPGQGLVPPSPGTDDLGELDLDAERLREAWLRAEHAAATAKQVLREALDAGQPWPVDARERPRSDQTRTARRVPSVDPLDAAAAVHGALLRMATEPTVVGENDPAFRTEPQHDPSEPMREVVDLRDGGCDGIGCSTPATVNDLDHHFPWPRGATTAAGLRNRSRRCHGAKHHGWTVETDTAGWSTWTSPGGRSYRRPPRYDPPPTPEPGRRASWLPRRDAPPDDGAGDAGKAGGVGQARGPG